MGRKRQMVEVRPRTVWGHCQGLYASQRELGAYQMPMVTGAGGGGRPPDAVVGEFSMVQQPVATKPAELTPSLFLLAVQDGQDRNVGLLPHLMALAPVKLPKFQEEPQDAGAGTSQGSGMKKGLGTGQNRNVFYIEYRQ